MQKEKNNGNKRTFMTKCDTTGSRDEQETLVTDKTESKQQDTEINKKKWKEKRKKKEN